MYKLQFFYIYNWYNYCCGTFLVWVLCGLLTMTLGSQNCYMRHWQLSCQFWAFHFRYSGRHEPDMDGWTDRHIIIDKYVQYVFVQQHHNANSPLITSNYYSPHKWKHIIKLRIVDKAHAYSNVYNWYNYCCGTFLVWVLCGLLTTTFGSQNFYLPLFLFNVYL